MTVAGTSVFSLVNARAETAEPPANASSGPLRIRIWSEGTAPKAVYPHDIDGALHEQFSRRGGAQVTRGRLSDPDAGLSEKALDQTDVLIWWGHLRHDELPSARSEAVVRRVREGKLGFVALHSSCASKPFRGLMGTACAPSAWREDGRPEHVQIHAPTHPIARGVAPFTIPRSDMFAEPFAVPEPETLVLVSKWDQGESVRSGLTWSVAKGRVVYLRTGPDAFPVLFHPSVRQLVANSAFWAGHRV